MSERGAGTEELSQRQKEVLRLVGQYMQAKEVALQLKIKESTVRSHMEEGRRRMGVATSREAARALLAKERDPALRNDDGPQSSGIAPTGFDPSSLGNEQDFSSERTISDGQLDGAGTGLEDARIPGKAAPDTGHDIDRTDTQSELRPGPSGVQYDRRDRLADRRSALFDRRLAALALWQWFGLALLITVLVAVSGGVLVQAALWVFKGLSEFRR